MKDAHGHGNLNMILAWSLVLSLSIGAISWGLPEVLTLHM